jgi:hypothetical protein
MSFLKDAVTSAFTALLTTAAEAAVPVSYGVKSCTGLRDSVTQGTQLTMDGNAGEVTGIVRVLASALDRPAKGDTLTIDGKTVFAGDCKLDPLGAVLTISFSETRPYEVAT